MSIDLCQYGRFQEFEEEKVPFWFQTFDNACVALFIAAIYIEVSTAGDVIFP